MNEQECTQVYEQLINILNQSKLGWVAAQVEEQVRLGKTVKKEIETLKESHGVFDLFTADENPRSFKKGPKATFPVTVKYQSSECLKLLLDAIEHVAVNTADMENHVVNCFGSEMGNWLGISFESEEIDVAPISIDKQTVISRLENAKRLKELLNTLRIEIEK